MRGLVDKQHYEKEEVAQITAILAAFRKSFPGLSIPNVLKITDDLGKTKAEYSPDLSSYDFSQWSATLAVGVSPLRVGAEEIIKLACTYQSERYARGIFNSGYLDEPIQLFLEFLKEKMAEFAGIDTRAEKSLEFAKQCITFITSLLQSEFFLPSNPICRESTLRVGISSETLTFYSVLLRVRDIFQRKVINVLARELANRSAREYLHQLVSTCDRLIFHGFSYLTYILRDGKNVAPGDVNTDVLVSPLRAVHRALAATTSGQSLSALAWIIQTSDVDPQFQIDNQFLSDSGESVLLLWDARKKVAMPEKLERLCEKNSGLAHYFCESYPECAAIRIHFLRLHGLIVELARVRKVWRISHELAGMVGDVGLYGASNVDVNSMILVSEHLMARMTETLITLNEAVYKYYEHIFATGGNEAAIWRKNFRQSWVYYEALTKDISSFNSQVGQLSVQVNSMSLPERLEKMRQTQAAFHEAAAACVMRVSTLFHLPIRMPTGMSALAASEPARLGTLTTAASIQILLDDASASRSAVSDRVVAASAPRSASAPRALSASSSTHMTRSPERVRVLGGALSGAARLGLYATSSGRAAQVEQSAAAPSSVAAQTASSVADIVLAADVTATGTAESELTTSARSWVRS